MSVAVADVVDHLSGLPPFPKVTAKLLNLLDDPLVSVEEFSQMISSDPSLVMKVIRLANSPFYMVRQPVESVRRAICILGLKTIKTITIAASVQKGFDDYSTRSDIFDYTKFWKHSYATAIAARKLAEAEKRLDKDKLYLAGLIHDVGTIILACHWPESWKQIMMRMESEHETPFTDIENLFFTVDHISLAATLCHNWQFPDDIVNIVKYHHNPDEAPEECASAARLLYLADNIATFQGFPFPDSDHIVEPFVELEDLNRSIGDLQFDVEHQLKSFDA